MGARRRLIAVHRFVLAGLLIATFGLAAAGPSPIGVWTGHVEFDKAKMVKGADPASQHNVDLLLAKYKSVALKLTLKSDKTYAITGDNRDSGTWSQAGQTITLRSSDKTKKRGSKDASLSADGKTITVLTGPIRVIFRR